MRSVVAGIHRLSLPVVVVLSLATTVAAQDQVLQRPTTESAQADDTVSSIEGGGYLDVGYLRSNNRPASHLWRSKSTSRILDRLVVNNATVHVLKRSRSTSRLGFKAGLQAGKDVEALDTNSGDLGHALKYLNDTYVTYLAPIGDREVGLIGGLIPGHLGYESFHAGDNPTYTRIYGVDNVPYFQWGAAAKYPYQGTVTGAVMVVSGWDYLASANSAPSYGGRVHWDISGNAWLRGNVFYGPEQAETSLEFWRTAMELMGEIRIGDFELVGNVGWGKEKQAALAGTPQYQWSWGALWLNWNPEGRPWSLGLRPEFFRDDDGLMTSARQTITALTAAVRYQMTTAKHRLQLRAEYRFDRSTGPDGGFFQGAGNVLVPEQHLFILGVNWRIDT